VNTILKEVDTADTKIGKIVRTPLLPITAGVLSVLSLFSPYSYRLGIDQLPVPVCVASLWALIVWATLYFTPYIKRITRKESGLSATVIVIATMTWMDFPSSILAACITWAAFALIILSKPRLQLWLNRLGVFWLPAILIVAVVWSGVSVLSRLPSESIAIGDKTGGVNIYFIIPDRFTSIDGLRELGDSPDEFVRELESKGFYIRENAKTADMLGLSIEPVYTTRTLRFLASVLNDGVNIPIGISYADASRMVKNSETIKRIKSQGYTYYNVGSWYQETKTSALADYNYFYQGYDLLSLLYSSELATAVMDRSILNELNIFPLQRFFGSTARRTEHVYQKNIVCTIADNTDNPKFVMVHLLLPHHPYVWGADGGELPTGLSESASYLQQANFAKGFLLSMIDGIQDKDSTACIIIQSDEGIQSPGKATPTAWIGQLTAWYMPGIPNSELNNVDTVGILKFAMDHIALRENE